MCVCVFVLYNNTGYSAGKKAGSPTSSLIIGKKVFKNLSKTKSPDQEEKYLAKCPCIMMHLRSQEDRKLSISHFRPSIIRQDDFFCEICYINI